MADNLDKKVNSIFVSAPSNIALIKYMGKTETTQNRPTNASLSYTLDKLRTYIRLTLKENGTEDSWSLLPSEDFPELKLQEMNLSEKGQKRFLKHFGLLKDQMNLKGFYLIESANNFPSDCGLASSASSFAALTLAAFEYNKVYNENEWSIKIAKSILEKYPQYANKIIQKDQIKEDIIIRELSRLSRQGSGSSCRSLMGPWALWAEDYAQTASFYYKELHHVAVIVESGKKEVSSSEAHVRVVTSPQFEGRPERAETRLDKLSMALQFGQWKAAFELCWDEFIDMHELFHSSQPSFRYMNSESDKVLKFLTGFWNDKKDGPLVTMDAGANIHLLFRPEQIELKKEILNHLKSEGVQTYVS